jgi:hypothetical protein
MNQFAVTVDNQGNLLVQPGSVIDLTAATTDYVTLGQTILSTVGQSLTLRQASQSGAVFVGGSGESLESAGTVTGTNAPIGYFQRVDEWEWVDQFGNTLLADPLGGTAEINIGANTIADLASWTTAPVGTFTATTYGEDEYNGGSAFTLAVTSEGTVANTIAEVVFNAGTGQSGTYTSSGWNEWTSDDDADWTLTINSDTTAEISDSINVIAERTEASARTPEGIYTSTTDGADDYNDGASFIVTVTFIPRFPLEGYAWVKIKLDTGAFDGAEGPYFSTTLPANSSTQEIVPIAYSNGDGLVIQIHDGPILFR